MSDQGALLSAGDSRPVAPPMPEIGGLLGRLIRLSPLNQRRLRNFQANRRGYWSLWIFMVMFVLSLFAEFLANDRPIVAQYKGEWLFPALVDYPEEKFGGFLAVTDYRDPVIAEEIRAHGFMIFPPIRFHHRSINRDLPVPARPRRPGCCRTRNAPPSPRKREARPVATSSGTGLARMIEGVMSSPG